MANAGLRIYNANNQVIIDSNYNNYMMVRKVELTQQMMLDRKVSFKHFNPQDVVTAYHTQYDISDLAVEPNLIFAVEASEKIMASAFASYISRAKGVTYLNVMIKDFSEDYVGTLYVFSYASTPKLPGPGFRLFNPNDPTDIVFDSRYNYLKPVAVLPVGSGQSVTLPIGTGQRYAILCGILGTYYYMYSSYYGGTLTFHNDWTKYIQGVFVSKTDGLMTVSSGETVATANGLSRGKGWIGYNYGYTVSGGQQKTQNEFTPASPAVIIDVSNY